MAIYGRCIGTIVTSETVNPKEKGKPAHHLLQVLQSPDGERAVLNAFKDYDLTSHYPPGSQFDALCRLAEWNIDKKFGQSATIIKNYTVSKRDSESVASSKKTSLV